MIKIKNILNTNNYFLLFLSLIIFLTLVYLEKDFGAYKADYFHAHSLSMSHLHGNLDIVTLLQTIPNSASGVLPLWIYGFTDNFYLRRGISILFVLIILLLVYFYAPNEKYKKYTLSSLALSPMLISATTWILPEVFALLLIYMIHALNRFPLVTLPLSLMLPWARQTFIVPLALRGAFIPINKIYFFINFVFAFAGLGFLYLIWGSLVPPNLTKVHLTPSVKSVIYALLIFSLYFFYSNVKSVLNEFKLTKFLISVTISFIIVTLHFYSQEVYGGGYIFSRIEKLIPYTAFIIEIALLTLLFYKSKISVLIFCIVSSISFCTTNYMFLKYVDFYILAFLSYGLSDIDEKNKLLFVSYAKSICVFQIFSLGLSFLYY